MHNCINATAKKATHVGTISNSHKHYLLKPMKLSATTLSVTYFLAWFALPILSQGCDQIRADCAPKNTSLRTANAHYLKDNHVFVVAFPDYMGLSNQFIHLRNALRAAFKFKAVVILSDMNCASHLFGFKCHPKYILDFHHLKSYCGKHNVTLVHQSIPIDQANLSDCIIPRPFTSTLLNDFHSCLFEMKHLTLTSDFFEAIPKSFTEHVLETRQFEKITKPSSYVKSIFATITGLLTDSTGCGFSSGNFIALHGRWEDTNVKWFKPNITDDEFRKIQTDIVISLAKSLRRIQTLDKLAGEAKCVYVSSGDPRPVEFLKKDFPGLSFVTKHDSSRFVEPEHTESGDIKKLDLLEELQVAHFDPGRPINMFSAFVDYMMFRRSKVALLYDGGSFARQQILSRCLIKRKHTYVIQNGNVMLSNCSDAPSSFLGLPQQYMI